MSVASPHPPDLPCAGCYAPCCTRGPHGWARAVNVAPDEQFPFPEVLVDGAIPYDENGRCPFLNADHRCSIYEHRPRLCREFRCDSDPNFLRVHPRVELLIGGQPWR
jgi:Fe-S-cluster containining protein